MSLSKLIENSNDKGHDLLTWVTEKIENISKISEDVSVDDDNGHVELETLNQTFNQLDDFLRQMVSSETLQDFDSHHIFNTISQLSSMVLFRIRKTYPGKVFDLAELLTYILSEEDVSSINNDENSKKSKKKSIKKTYIFKPVKDLAAVLLTHIFELYQHEITTLIPSLYTTIFKNLKKILEKPKYYHATFMVSLTTLLSTIMRNDESERIAPYLSKFTKLSKNVFEIIYEHDNSLPVDMIAMIIDGWVAVLTHDTFIKDHSDNLITSIYSKFQESELGIYGFANDGTRPYTAKILAEVLFTYQYSKGFIELKDALELYARIFSNAKTRDTKSGCFESIIHFISLNIYSNETFLSGNLYLEIVKYLSSIFNNKNIEHLSLSTISRYLRYFTHMHKVLFPYISDSSKTQMLIKLTQEITDVSNDLEYKVEDNQWTTALKLELLEILLKDLSSSFTSEEQLTKDIKDKLLKLCTSEIFTTRLYGSKVLKVFLYNCPQFICEVVESSLNLLVNAFKNKDSTSYSILHGNAFLISNLIEISGKDYVPYELIMRITVFATSFIKNNTTSTSATLYYKGLICWILMIGLMNYEDPNYLSMQTSQLFLFWKVLLTHSFTYRTEEELSRNLEIRTHALTCLLSFLSNSKIDSTVAKQISYLLTKCSNFNHSVNLKSSNIDRILLNNECKLLQVYLKIKDFIKYDFDSSLLILITKNFSDPNLYINASTNIIKSLKSITKQKNKSEQNNERVVDFTVDGILRQSDDFAYGISSKIHKNRVDIVGGTDLDNDHTLVNSLWHTKDLTWCENFEEEVIQPISPVLSNDSLVLLYGKLSNRESNDYLPSITTSLIDFSMELFSSVFPFLNSKIQYSVLENLNLSIFSKATTPLRSVALSANVCTAIYGCLQYVQEQNLVLQEFVGNSMIETLKKIEFFNDAYLTTLKSECIGLICSAVARSLEIKDKQIFIDEQLRVLIKNLIEVEEPYPRKLSLLTLSAIYKYNPNVASFTTIIDILLTLLKDPHPVIHSWTLRSLLQLLEKNLTTDLQLMSQLLQSLENYLIDPSYGLFSSSAICYNYNKEFNSQIMIIMITNSLTEKIGPNFVDLKSDNINSFKNITLSSLLSSNPVCLVESLKIYENIATFKLEGLFDDAIFMKTLYHSINQSMNIGLGSGHNNSVFTRQIETVEFTSSPVVAFQNFELLNQLFKLGKVDLFSSDIEMVTWRYLTLHPENESIKSFFNEWIMLTVDDEKWFNKLYSMMTSSDEKLFKGYFKFLSSVQKEKIRYSTRSSLELHKVHNTSDQQDKQISDSADSYNWKRQYVLLSLFYKLLTTSMKGIKLVAIVANNVENSIKFAFQAATSKVELLNIKGMEILSSLLQLFSSEQLETNYDKNLLINQEAQIISALMAVFQRGTSARVIAMAINVCGDFICFNGSITPLIQRVGSILVKLLEIFNESSTSDVLFNDIQLPTKKFKKLIELSTLNAWAKITQQAFITKNSDLLEFTLPYWSVLVPLWIITLREYMIIRYVDMTADTEALKILIDHKSSTNMVRLLQEPLWVNLVIVLGSILKHDKTIIYKCLNDEELESFMFILLAKCLELFLKNPDEESIKTNLLLAIDSILNSGILFKFLLEDEIFQEFLSIFERSAESDNLIEVKLVIKIIGGFINSYTQTNSSKDSFLENINKLYDLLQILFGVASNILPFIEYGSIEPGDGNLILTDAKVDVLKNTFDILGKSISNFVPVFRNDLYACLLYLIGQIYFSKVNNEVIPIALPLLKVICSETINSSKDYEIIDIFYNSISTLLSEGELATNNVLATYFIFIISGYDHFTEKTLNDISTLMFTNFKITETHELVEHSIINIVEKQSTTNSANYILHKFFNHCLTNTSKDSSEIVFKYELLLKCTTTIGKSDPKKIGPSMVLFLKFICESPNLHKLVSFERMEGAIQLFESNSELFKEIVSKYLDSNEKETLQQLIQNQNSSTHKKVQSDKLILKSFE